LLLAATVVLVLLGGVHSLLGERLILRHLRAVRGLPHLLGSEELTRRTLRFVWHVATLLAWGSAATTLRFSQVERLGSGERFALAALSWSLGACAALTLVVTRARHAGWAAFLAAALLTGFGGR
jgi:hypothetical protein